MSKYSNSFKGVNLAHYILILIVVILIVIDFDVPLELAKIIQHPVGFGAFILVGVYAFFVNPILGIVTLFLLYELGRRISSPMTPFRHYTGNSREAHLTAYNQFERTLEEDIVNDLVPMISEVSLGGPSYEPVVDKSIDASTL
jgi:hypothetical protein